jgi:Ca2+/Na+ antiporter
MINIHETHLLMIIVLTALITYLIYSYYLNCSIECKINYYRYENYHDKKNIPEPQNVHQVMTKDVNNNLPINILSDNFDINKNINTYDIGNKTSSHSSSIQSTNLEGDDQDDFYINKFFNGIY